jgi:hypothetical protein
VNLRDYQDIIRVSQEIFDEYKDYSYQELEEIVRDLYEDSDADLDKFHELCDLRNLVRKKDRIEKQVNKPVESILVRSSKSY